MPLLSLALLTLLSLSSPFPLSPSSPSLFEEADAIVHSQKDDGRFSILSRARDSRSSSLPSHFLFFLHLSTLSNAYLASPKKAYALSAEKGIRWFIRRMERRTFLNSVTMNSFEMKYIEMLSNVSFANVSRRETGEGGEREREDGERMRRREEKDGMEREREGGDGKGLYADDVFATLSLECKGIFVSKISLLLRSQEKIGSSLKGWRSPLSVLSPSLISLSLSPPSLSNSSSLFPFSLFSLFQMERENILPDYLATYYAIESFLLIPMPSLAVKKSLESALNWLQDEGLKLRGREEREKGGRERGEESPFSLFSRILSHYLSLTGPLLSPPPLSPSSSLSLRRHKGGMLFHVIYATSPPQYPALSASLLSLFSSSLSPSRIRAWIFVTTDDMNALNEHLNGCFASFPYRHLISLFPFKEDIVRERSESVHRDDLGSAYNFVRFYMPSLFAMFGKEYLYVDADTIFLGDVGDFFTVEKKNPEFCVTAYGDKVLISLTSEQRIIMREVAEEMSFVAGVLLVNVTCWIKDELTSKVEGWIRRHKIDPIYRHASQPPLQLAVGKRFNHIPHWVDHSFGYESPPQLSVKRQIAFRYPVRSKILHWNGIVKPWMKSGGDFQDYWIPFSCSLDHVPNDLSPALSHSPSPSSPNPSPHEFDERHPRRLSEEKERRVKRVDRLRRRRP